MLDPKMPVVVELDVDEERTWNERNLDVRRKCCGHLELFHAFNDIYVRDYCTIRNCDC
jgi:hypothetical protein